MSNYEKNFWENLFWNIHPSLTMADFRNVKYHPTTHKNSWRNRY